MTDPGLNKLEKYERKIVELAEENQELKSEKAYWRNKALLIEQTGRVFNAVLQAFIGFLTGTLRVLTDPTMLGLVFFFPIGYIIVMGDFGHPSINFALCATQLSSGFPISNWLKKKGWTRLAEFFMGWGLMAIATFFVLFGKFILWLLGFSVF